MGTRVDRAGERHLYRVEVTAEGAAWPAPRCLTCPDEGREEEEGVSDDPVCIRIGITTYV